MRKMEPMTLEQTASLRQVAKASGTREHALVSLMLSHFVRASEVTGLLAGAVDLKAKTVTITRLKGSLTKTEALLPGEAEALAAWLAVKPVSPYLFPGRAGRMSRQQLFNIFEGLCTQAGVPASSAAPHAARHTIGQLMADAGCQAKEIQQAAGHKSLNSTGQYFEFRQSRVDAAKAKALGFEVAA
jgi:integrase/recombinase XerD